MVVLGILGGQEIILILIVVLVLFGGRKIPELMRGIGQGVKEFNKAKDGITGEEFKKESEKDNLHKEQK